MYSTAIVTHALGLFTFAALSSASHCGDTTIDASACDAPCIHRMLYYTAFSSAASGFKRTIEAYDAAEWCTTGEKAAWCPEFLNQAVSGVASESVEQASVDFENCDERCLLMSLADISQNATIRGLLEAQSLLGDFEELDGDHKKIKRLNETIADLSQQSQADVDQCHLQKAMTSDKKMKSSKEDDDLKALAIGLPFLAAPALMLGPFVVDKVCEIDPVLCSGRTMSYLRSLFRGAKEVLSESSSLRSIIESESTSSLQIIDLSPPGSPIEGHYADNRLPTIPEEPEDPEHPFRLPHQDGPDAKFPPSKHKPGRTQYQGEDPDMPNEYPEDLEAGNSIASTESESQSLYRLENFDMAAGLAEQLTLREVKDEAEVASFERIFPRPPDPGQALRMYDQLDAEGKLITKRWVLPKLLRPMEGEWVRDSADPNRFIQLDDGAPALDSLGQPLVAEGSTMLTTTPVIDGAGLISYETSFGAAGPVVGSMPLGPPVAEPLIVGTPGNAAFPDLPFLDLPSFPFFAHHDGGDDDDGDDSHENHDEEDDDDDEYSHENHDDDDDDDDDGSHDNHEEEDDAGKSDDDYEEDKTVSASTPHEDTRHSRTYHYPTPVPTTFSTETRSQTTSSSSSTSSSTTGTSSSASHTIASTVSINIAMPSISDLPPKCIGNALTLQVKDHDDRKECDERVGDLNRIDSLRWISAVLPLSCLASEQWERHHDDIESSPLEELKNTECQDLVKHKFTNHEKLTWIGAMLPPECPYNRHDPDDPEKDNESTDEHLSDHHMKFCKKAAKKLIKFAGAD